MDYSPYAANLGKKCDYETWTDWAKCKVGKKESLQLSWMAKKKRSVTNKLKLAAKIGAGVAKNTPAGRAAMLTVKAASKVSGVPIPTAESLMKRGAPAEEAYYIGELAVASEAGDSGASAELASYYANKSIECSRLSQLYRE